MSAPVRPEAGRAVAAAVAGNVLEWYDFAVYVYLTTIIARQFFPAGDDVTSLLSAFAAFGIGFLARPVGGIVIGRLGDSMGRKSALLLTISLMAAGTVLIGVTPSYASIGVAAPILVVAARLMQGFSAGGEWGSSTAFIVEWAPEHRRGLYGSLQQCSVAGGLLLGSTVAALMGTLLSADALDRWGWRIPFLLGGLIGPLGLYMRRRIGETPAFASVRTAAARSAEPAPMGLAARAFGFTVVWTVSYYLLLAYLPTFLQKQAGLPSTQALWSTTCALAVLVLATPLMGLLSDRVGRKPLLLAACIGFIALPYPLFGVMLSSGSLGPIVAAHALLALCLAVFSGPGPAAIAELFPTHGRSTWMSTGYSLSVALFGGFAPFIAAWLIVRTGSALSPAWYVMAAAVVSMTVILGLQETAGRPLR